VRRWRAFCAGHFLPICVTTLRDVILLCRHPGMVRPKVGEIPGLEHAAGREAAKRSSRRGNLVSKAQINVHATTRLKSSVGWRHWGRHRIWISLIEIVVATVRGSQLAPSTDREKHLASRYTGDR
jgi:hypothetical protein